MGKMDDWKVGWETGVGSPKKDFHCELCAFFVTLCG